MRYLSTLYIRNHRARVRHRRGSLLVSSPNGRQRIPLESIDALVIFGGAQVTMQALEACVNRRVRVVFLKMSGAIRFVVGGGTGGNVHLRLAQFRNATDKHLSLNIARAIVAAKLQNSLKVVSRWARDERNPITREYLEKRCNAIRGRISRTRSVETADQLRGTEGDVARMYFRALGKVVSSSGLAFSNRSRRPPRDPVNAMLGFCYNLLVTECIGAIESVGLDFQIGFLHRPRSGRPSLALDLAEEFRALTDRFVVTLIRRRQVVSDSFVDMPGGAVYLSDQGRNNLLSMWEKHKDGEIYHKMLGRSITRWALPMTQATLLARHLRNDLASYPPFVLR